MSRYVIVSVALGRPIGYLFPEWAKSIEAVAGKVAPLGELAKAGGVIAWCLAPGFDECKEVCRIER